MSEQDPEKKIPIIVHQTKKPKTGEGYDWDPIYHERKKSQPIAWKKINTDAHSDPEGFLLPPELDEPGMSTQPPLLNSEKRDKEE